MLVIMLVQIVITIIIVVGVFMNLVIMLMHMVITIIIVVGALNHHGGGHAHAYSKHDRGGTLDYYGHVHEYGDHAHNCGGLAIMVSTFII